ncbi:1,2-phenylacetyl-CoA epoxidase subunit PaaD [Microlunatus panaciterrae]|nr:1,2-phenylacetyl-CoA epoxidase subunit PaaD [Microlunatus panaciterrae]
MAHDHQQTATRRAWHVAAQLVDPEIPVISIADLGILRDVQVDGERVTATITPTYSGCPALDAIRADLDQALRAAGFTEVVIKTALSPAWTTDWITAAGREALETFGIAPPAVATPSATTRSGPVTVQLSVHCPQCGSLNTEETSHFGSTSCKALWRCRDCHEPFDYFKAL